MQTQPTSKRGRPTLTEQTRKQRVVVYLPPTLVQWLTETATKQGRRRVADRVESLLKEAKDK